MGIEFQKERVSTELLDPQKAFQKSTLEVEVRIDPILHYHSRITPRRKTPASSPHKVLPPIPEEILSPSTCIFCPHGLELKTTKFPPPFKKERFTYQESVLFPNLNPYGDYSAVAIFSGAHYIEIGAFPEALICDCYLNCLDFIRAVFEQDPRVTHVAITQNYLPGAGGTLIHPHLQVNVFSIPTNFQGRLLKKARQYYEQNQTNAFLDLLAAEKNIGQRFILEDDRLGWVTTFAPKGKYDFTAIFKLPKGITDLDQKDLTSLSKGIAAIQDYYRYQGRNSFNSALYGIRGEDGAFRLLFTMLARSVYQPYYRNDQSFFEVVLGESATVDKPEDICREVQPFFEKRYGQKKSYQPEISRE